MIMRNKKEEEKKGEDTKTRRRIIVPGLILPEEAEPRTCFPLLFKGSILSDQTDPNLVAKQLDKALCIANANFVNFKLIPINVFIGHGNVDFLALVESLHIQELEASERKKQVEKEEKETNESNTEVNDNE